MKRIEPMALSKEVETVEDGVSDEAEVAGMTGTRIADVL